MTSQLWILCGGNGAGKSTFYRTFLLPKGLEIVSVDEAARQFEPLNPSDAISEAQHWVDKKRYRMLERKNSFCYETVFSHPSKIDFVADAKAGGYEVILVYIHLESPELNEARVNQRVSEGGHNVPPDKIKSRIPKTIKNVAATIPLVDTAYLLDNSSYSEPFKVVAIFNNGQVSRYIQTLPTWLSEMSIE